MIRVGVTGGIGSGKSTVCRLFAERGVPVYDSDSEAKRLMREDPSLRAALVEAFGDETFRDGVLNRRYLAATSSATDAPWLGSKRWCTPA